jgi:hypothetical protein
MYLQSKSIPIIVIAITLVASVAVLGINSISTVKAASDSYGKTIIAPNAHTGEWGKEVSTAAKDGSGHGIGDWRANDCKITDRTQDNPGGVC